MTANPASPPNSAATDSLAGSREGPSNSAPYSACRTPLLHRDQSLLQSLLTLRLDFSALALKEDLPADELIAWAESPAIAPRIQSLRRLAHLSLDIRLAQARRAAVDILESIALTAEDPIEKRRAASALLRRPDAPIRSANPGGDHTSRSESGHPHAPREASSPHRSPLTDHRSPPHPSPSKPAPDPDLPPDAIASRAVDALLFAGEPAQALANLFPLLAPAADVCGKPAPPSIAEFIASHSTCPAAQIPHFRHTRDIKLGHSGTSDAGELFLLHTLSTAGAHQKLLFTISQRLGRWLITRIEEPASHPPPGSGAGEVPAPAPAEGAPSSYSSLPTLQSPTTPHPAPVTNGAPTQHSAPQHSGPSLHHLTTSSTAPPATVPP